MEQGVKLCNVFKCDGKAALSIRDHYASKCLSYAAFHYVILSCFNHPTQGMRLMYRVVRK
jgi:hypothetical protein